MDRAPFDEARLAGETLSLVHALCEALDWRAAVELTESLAAVCPEAANVADESAALVYLDEAIAKFSYGFHFPNFYAAERTEFRRAVSNALTQCSWSVVGREYQIRLTLNHYPRRFQTRKQFVNIGEYDQARAFYACLGDLVQDVPELRTAELFQALERAAQPVAGMPTSSDLFPNPLYDHIRSPLYDHDAWMNSATPYQRAVLVLDEAFDAFNDSLDSIVGFVAAQHRTHE